MNKKTFMERVKNEIEGYLPEEYRGASINLEEVTKNNDTKMCGLSILREDDNMSPLIYLDRYYNQFEGGEDMEKILESIAHEYVTSMGYVMPEIEPDLDYENIREHLRPKLIDSLSNRDLLKEVVSYTNELGLAVVPYIDFERSEGYPGIAVVTKEMAAVHEYDEDRVIRDAIKNEPGITDPKLYDLEDMMFSFLGEPDDLFENTDMVRSQSNILVLTNKERYLGAAMIIYPEVLEAIGNILGSDYYVLPSSIHEVIIMRDQGLMTPKEMVQMVERINDTVVNPEDRLGNRVFRYRCDIRQLSVAAEPEKQRPQERGR